MYELVMTMPKPIALSWDRGMSLQTGWMTGVRQGVSKLLSPSVITPIRPIRSVSFTSKEKRLAIVVPTAEIWFTYQGSEGARSEHDHDADGEAGLQGPGGPCPRDLCRPVLRGIPAHIPPGVLGLGGHRPQGNHRRATGAQPCDDAAP